MQCEMPGAMPEPEKGPRENPSYSGSGVNFSAVTNVPHSPTREREGKRCSRRQELSLVLCHFPVRVKLFHNKKLIEKKLGEPRRKGRREAKPVVWKGRPCDWEGEMLEPLRLWVGRPESSSQADCIPI